MTKERSDQYTFARGYYDGRAKQKNENPYSKNLWAEITYLHDLYQDGYNQGIADRQAEEPTA